MAKGWLTPTCVSAAGSTNTAQSKTATRRFEGAARLPKSYDISGMELGLAFEAPGGSVQADAIVRNMAPPKALAWP